MRRLIAGAIVALAVIAAVALAMAGWHYSDQILGPDSPRVLIGQPVLARTGSTIVLGTTHKALRPGPWALEWPGGFGEIGNILSADSARVVRRFRLAKGFAPPASARLAGFAFDADPSSWLGVPYRNVAVPALIGELPSWLVPGADSTWAIFVHGRAATRAEVLRMLPAYQALGLPCLVISYRNDLGAPVIDDGRYRLGSTEWRDLEDAVRYALDQGARDVVLVGCSMGGGIVAEFLRRSAFRSNVRAAVLDAPALDWDAVLALAAKKRHLPAALTSLGKFFATQRSGIRWDDLVQVRHASEFATPMLILHGEADDVVPVEVSRRFAAARPDLVMLVTFAGAGHVESSNYDGARYARAIEDWLRSKPVGLP